MSYAYKKDTKGERHGTPAERMMADQMAATMAAQSRPNQLFSAGDQAAVLSIRADGCAVVQSEWGFAGAVMLLDCQGDFWATSNHHGRLQH